MFPSAKSTIFKILLLYLGTSAIFLCIGFYYFNLKITQNILFSQMASLRDTSFDMVEIIRKYNHNIKLSLPEIIKTSEMPFAIYNKNNQLLFSNLSKNPTLEEFQRGFYRVQNKIIVNPASNIPQGIHKKKRNAPYKIFLEDDSLEGEILLMRLKLVVIFLGIFGFMGVVATILVNLFLNPLKKTIKLLDTFIKDSTHEINTPLSVILMSIEHLKKENLPNDELKKLERIKLASLQLNQIYHALVAYNFPQKALKKQLDLNEILKERIDYFTPFLLQKKITLHSCINPSILYADKEQITILIDNLLSNAIKYNKKGGAIEICLKQNQLSIKDSGFGIKEECVERVFDRYARFNEDSGGFGIGLSLVKRICDECEIKIHINTSNTGSEFILTWCNAGQNEIN